MPSPLAVVSRVCPVALFFTITRALGTAALFGSVTRPLMPAVPSCAGTDADHNKASDVPRIAENSFREIMMSSYVIRPYQLTMVAGGVGSVRSSKSAFAKHACRSAHVQIG